MGRSYTAHQQGVWLLFFFFFPNARDTQIESVFKFVFLWMDWPVGQACQIESKAACPKTRP